MSASEKANLARIRDNQRRSRARRKEYLQELEHRLRQCELQGVEASSDIQLAARKVAEENKKLRGLLVQHGVADDSIDLYLQSSPTSDTVIGNNFGVSNGAVQVLEQLLRTRKSCCSDGNTGALSNSRESSSVSTVNSSWDTTSLHQRSVGAQPIGIVVPSAQQYMTPSVSSAGSISYRSSHSMSDYQRIQGQSAEWGQQFPDSFTVTNHLPCNSRHTTQLHLRSGYISSSNVNSCVTATDMITTMAGADASVVREDLGCLPGVDCEVNNHDIFHVMDRHSGSGVGL